MDPNEKVVPIEFKDYIQAANTRKRFAIKDTVTNLYRTDAPPESIEAWTSSRCGARMFVTAKAAKAALYEMWADRLADVIAALDYQNAKYGLKLLRAGKLFAQEYGCEIKHQTN